MQTCMELPPGTPSSAYTKHVSEELLDETELGVALHSSDDGREELREAACASFPLTLNEQFKFQKRKRQFSALDFVRMDSEKANSNSILFRNLGCRISVKKRLLLYLVFLGAIAGPIDYSIRMGIRIIYSTRLGIASKFVDQPTTSFLVWTCTALVLVLSAVCLTETISSASAGSGLPEVKAILAGGDIKHFFTLRTLFVKIIGLIMAAGAGLSIGREGPFVHITCIIGHTILQLRWFKEYFFERKRYRLQLIGTAAAVGVAANLNAPLGGVLFSIEVTTTYYLFDNYWKSFLSTISASLFLSLLRIYCSPTAGFSQIYQTNYPLNSYAVYELPLFLILGIIMGIFGGLIVKTFVYVKKSFQKIPNTCLFQFLKKYGVPFTLTVITSAITFFPGSFMRRYASDSVHILFSEKQLPDDWTLYSSYFSLTYFGLAVLLLTPFSIALSIPAGVFVPTVASGAAFGRLFAITIQDYVLPMFGSGLRNSIFPGIYAICGGASLSTGVTRTISTAVLALEVTGQYSICLPIFIAVLGSYGSANFISPSLFDEVLKLKDLPYLPVLKYHKKILVQEAMDRNIQFLTKKITLKQILLNVYFMKKRTIPVIETIDFGKSVLLGFISKRDLISILEDVYKSNDLIQFEQDISIDSLSSRNIQHSKSFLSRSMRFAYQNVLKFGDNKAAPNLQNKEVLSSILEGSWSPKKKAILNSEIDIVDFLGEDYLEPSILTVPHNTPLEDVHIIFAMMRCRSLYVTTCGALSGEITIQHLLNSTKNN